MLDDPFDVARPYVPRKPVPDFRTEFYQESPDMRPTEGRANPGTAYVCRYVDGRHEPPQPWCPHFDAVDETGFRIRPDWTTQQE